MGFPLRLTLRLAPAVALAAALGAAPSAAQTPSVCAPEAPVLTGPVAVQAGETYSVSWTNVLGTTVAASSANAYVVQRALDAAFTKVTDTTTTQRSAWTFPAAPAGATTLYHRVNVPSSCPTFAAIWSNVLAVPVNDVCPVPSTVGALSASPDNPPAFSTWVISWNTLGAGPGPGGTYTNLTFRIRRTSALEPNGSEWVVTNGAASFAGPPGDYVFEVRAEAACGTVGPWSPPKKVTVGTVTQPPLVVVSEPQPLAQVVPAAGVKPATFFRVRNAGTATVTAYTTCDDSGFAIAPSQFTLAPGATQDVSVTSLYVTALGAPVHASVAVTSGASTLSVPILLVLAPKPAAAPVSWSVDKVYVDVNGTAFAASLLNSGATAASFVGSVKAPWIAVQSLDGQTWDRPMAPFETRPVLLVIDRAKRRGETGTEVGAIALSTAGFTAPETLVVTDDGPRILPAAVGAPSLPAASAKTRILYASFPNALDAKGVGRFAADLWITNTDVVNPIRVSLFFNPVGGPGDGSAIQRFDIQLAAGEVRRYRNVVATLLGASGAYTVEVRSAATTVSSTALVANTAIPAVAAARRVLTGAATGSYGLEMRPTSPGEGAKQSDPVQIVSGLAHDANRRSNILLLETSGYDTTVLLSLYDGNGDLVIRNGQPVVLQKTVPANGTLQINDAEELFDAPPLAAGAYAYALITWKSSAADATGAQNGSVVGMATVIDNRTQDASLHIGVSTNALNPDYVPTSSSLAGRASLASLPYSGGPASLFFPTVHSSGAALASGEKPFWRTRVTLTNVSGTQRQMVLAYQDAADPTIKRQTTVGLSGHGGVVSFEDILESSAMGILPGQNSYGTVQIAAVQNRDGTWATGWDGVDVQTESYTVDPAQGVGDYKTGMEGYAYFHGYSSFQSNLGTMSFDGAENSTSYRTNLILNEVGGSSYCDVVIAAYLPGSFVPVASVTKRIPPAGYFSDELFTNVLGLNLTEVTDVRIVVRQIAGDGVFLAFASKIDRASGDPANIFLRPAAAGTGR